MQHHADSIIRVNGSRADGSEGPRGPCYLLQTVMNESRKRRSNSICMFTSSSIVLHPAVFLVHYLTLMSMTSVFAVTTEYIAYAYKNLPQCCCSVHTNNLSCIQRFRGASAFNAKKQKTNKHGWPELRAGGKPQSHLFFGVA